LSPPIALQHTEHLVNRRAATDISDERRFGAMGEPMHPAMRRVVKTCAFAVTLLLTGCLTTEKPVFGSGDFVQPKSIAGDWIAKSDKGDVMRVRVSEKGSVFRAEPLTSKGVVDASENPIDFGLVPLGHDEFVFVQADDSSGSVTYLGLRAERGQITITVFAGGDEGDGTKAKFDALVASLGMGRDATFNYEARLTGDVTADKIKKLFTALLDNPKAYGGQASVYKSFKH
jgi:hypothetical protein